MNKLLLGQTIFSLQIPERICIIGSPGSGKTTLSWALKEALDLPLIRMSDLSNEMDTVLSRNAPRQDRMTYLEQALSNRPWITDGYFSISLDVRFRLADLIIFLDLPLHVCLYSVLTRSWKNLFGFQGTSHSDYATTFLRRFCYFFSPRIYWRVISFHVRKRPRLLQKLQPWSELKTVLILKNRSEANQLADAQVWQHLRSERVYIPHEG